MLSEFKYFHNKKGKSRDVKALKQPHNWDLSISNMLILVPWIAHITDGTIKINSAKVFGLLAKSGILVRKMDVYGIKNSLRITIGTTTENIALMKKMRKVLNVR